MYFFSKRQQNLHIKGNYKHKNDNKSICYSLINTYKEGICELKQIDFRFLQIFNFRDVYKNQKEAHYMSHHVTALNAH